MEFDRESVDNLAERCKQETEKYFQQMKNDPCYCYELFSRAFSSDSDKALHYLYVIYRPLVISWIQQHPYYKKITSSVDELFFDSMSHFILAIKKRSIKDFPSLSHILTYLRKCVHSEIITIRRKYTAIESDFNENCIMPYEDDLDEKIISKQAWNRIEEFLKDPKELLLARLVFLQHLKPSHIHKEFPHLWQDTNEIRVDRQRIMRKLQKDDVLKKILDGFFNVNE